MFSKYVNNHKSPLATGRIKINIGDKVPDRGFSEKEIESIKEWINKGYLVKESVAKANPVELAPPVVAVKELSPEINRIDEIQPKVEVVVEEEVKEEEVKVVEEEVKVVEEEVKVVEEKVVEKPHKRSKKVTEE